MENPQKQPSEIIKQKAAEISSQVNVELAKLNPADYASPELYMGSVFALFFDAIHGAVATGYLIGIQDPEMIKLNTQGAANGTENTASN